MSKAEKVKKVKKPRGIESVRNSYGYKFITLWLIGQILFVIKPIIESITYSFSKVKIAAGGLEQTFVGLENWKYMLNEDALYVENLRNGVTNMLTSLPIIVALSLVLAIILNQNFKGRLIFRAIFFLPLVIATPVIMEILSSNWLQIPLFSMNSGAEYEYGGIIDFNGLLSGLNLPSQINDLFTEYLGNVFGLIWSCGIQIILFLSGLQSIPEQLYEVSRVEGATKWEEFWYVTVPMLKDVILLVLVYTMISLFTALDNPVIKQAYSVMQKQQSYDMSSAMLWGYFIIVGLLLGLVLWAYRHFCLKKWG